MYYPPYCKVCTGNKYKQWINENRDRKRERDREWVKKPENVPKVRRNQKLYIKRGKRKQWDEKNKDKLKGYIEYKSMHATHTITNEEWENCKNYFNYRCAYCGLLIEEHWVKFNKGWILGDFHRDHVDHEGANDLSNCVPACKSCNSRKWKFKINDWYNEENKNYTHERMSKIIKWLSEDFLKYIHKITN